MYEKLIFKLKIIKEEWNSKFKKLKAYFSKDTLELSIFKLKI